MEVQESGKEVSPETPKQQQKMSPKVEREVEAYISGLSRMLHSKETTGNVMAMLKSGEPGQVIPQTALTVNNQMEQAAVKGGKKPSLDVLLNAGVFLVNDLIEMGNAAGVFQIETEEQISPIVKGTLQAYIEKGLADGSVDPVELQQKVEPLMGEEHKAAGLEAASMTGIPAEASQETAMHQYGEQKKREGMLKGKKGGNR